MEQSQFLIVNLLLALIIVVVTSVSDKSNNCLLNQNDVKNFIKTIGEDFGITIDQSLEGDHCSKMIQDSITAAASLRFYLNEQKFDSSFHLLLIERMEEKFAEEFPILSVKASRLFKEYINALEKNARMWWKIDYYSHLSSEKNESDCYECELASDSELFTHLNMIFFTATGNHGNVHHCKPLMYYEKLASSKLNSYPKKLAKFYSKNEKAFLELKYKIKFNQSFDIDEAINEYAEILTSLTNTLNNQILTNKERKEYSLQIGIDTAEVMIRKGENFDEAREIFSQITTENVKRDIISKAFNCRLENFDNLKKFVDKLGAAGLLMLKEMFVECQFSKVDADLVILAESKLNILSENKSVREVYEKYANDIRRNNSQAIATKVRHFCNKIVDCNSIVHEAYFTAYFEKVTEFIDFLGVLDQAISARKLFKIVKEYSVNKVEQVMFAVWLKAKLNGIEEKTEPNSEHILRLKAKKILESIKDDLPDGTKALVFAENFVIEANETAKCRLKAFKPKTNLTSCKYDYKIKAIPLEGGKYFRLENCENRALFSAQQHNKFIVSAGAGKNDFYKWKILPSENESYFYIFNKGSENALSSDELRICAQMSSFRLFFQRCSKYEVFDLTYPGTNLSSQLWKISAN